MTEAIDLSDIIRHHGHLGGFAVLGFKAGELLISRLAAKRYFGLHIVVWCPPQPPPSCLIDGIQLSTGCSVGKGNLHLRPSQTIYVRAANVNTGAQICIVPRDGLVNELLKMTKEQGPDAAGRWVWSHSPDELWVVTEQQPPW